VHPVGEVATAKAAQEKGAVFILSMASSCSIEKVAASAPSVRKWLQLCIFKDRAVTENLIKRSEAAGFEALVLAVDRPVLGIRNIKVNISTSLPNMEYVCRKLIEIYKYFVLTMYNYLSLTDCQTSRTSEKYLVATQ
jgi:isopentenyl diphosphate isomerase/L-lactate dehydrogenase-like FMN-dependent dehydrogenase